MTLKSVWKTPAKLQTTGNTPFSDMPFYQYLMDVERGGRPQHFLSHLFKFLKQHGYKRGFRLDDELLTHHEHCWRFYQDFWMPQREPIAFEDLLVPASEGFVVWHRGGRYRPTQRLMKFYKQWDLIYHVTPANYYFQVSESGLLWLKYQQIIGSRLVCQLKQD